MSLINFGWLRKKPRYPNDDVIKGFKFEANLVPSTPLAILERHGETVMGEQPADYPCRSPHGGWSAILKTWGELGIPGMKEKPPSKVANPIGPVDEGGGDLLPFLKDFRRIIETYDTPEVRIKLIFELSNRSAEYGAVFNSLCNAHENFMDHWAGYEAALGIEGAGIKIQIVKDLYLSGIRSAEELGAADDKALLAIKGIGPAMVSRIRKWLNKVR